MSLLMETDKSADVDILLNPGFSSVWIASSYATTLGDDLTSSVQYCWTINPFL